MIDLRTRAAFNKGCIPDSTDFTSGANFRERLGEVPKDRTLVLISDADAQDDVARAWQYLIDKGYDSALVKYLDGGIQAWTDAGYELLYAKDIDDMRAIGC